MTHSDTLQLIKQPDPPPSPTASWSFTIIDWIAPFLRNRVPDTNSFGNEIDTTIAVDILDDGVGVNLSTIDAYVDGYLAFTGGTTFIAPFNGPLSALTDTSVDGYDGYHLVLDSTADFAPSAQKAIRITARDLKGNQLDETYNFRVGVSATVIVSPYEITLDINFSGAMAVGAELQDPTNYDFDNGMYARLVEVISSTQVRLWVELFHSVSPFTLTFSASIADAYGGVLVPTSNPLTIVPFQATADLTNYNGKVRSGRESRLIRADSQRIYLAGSKGIDIFRKDAESNPVRWGQVLDAYGIDAMFIANFGGDLVITDTTPPFLSGQNPVPGGSTSASDVIAFTIEDLTTAVEITSTTIYVNNTLAFSGGFNGWSNGYGGKIVVGPKSLVFEISPPASLPVGSGSVRVVATDLLGNSIDQTYSFSVVEALGFGFGAFGFASFGGV